MHSCRWHILCGLTLFLVGCTDQERPATGATAGGASPEEVYDAMRTYQETGNHGAYFQLMTKEVQNRLLAGRALMAEMSVIDSDASPAKRDPARENELKGIFGKFGAPYDATEEEFTASLEKVSDPTGFYIALETFSAKFAGDRITRTTHFGPMDDLKVVGDRATAMAQYNRPAGAKVTAPIHFRLIDGRWYMDA